MGQDGAGWWMSESLKAEINRLSAVITELPGLLPGARKPVDSLDSSEDASFSIMLISFWRF